MSHAAVRDVAGHDGPFCCPDPTTHPDAGVDDAAWSQQRERADAGSDQFRPIGAGPPVRQDAEGLDHVVGSDVTALVDQDCRADRSPRPDPDITADERSRPDRSLHRR